MKKSEKISIIHRHYQNALLTIDLVNKIIDFIEDELDIETNKVMLADSWCSDDVNSIQYPARASEFLGPFKLGGLDGFPFVGATGMGAFANHVPHDGIALVLFGPHIGISADGSLGTIHRIGQDEKTGCCGAAGAGLAKLASNRIVQDHVTEIDYQMNVLEQIMLQQKDRILNADSQIKETTAVIYEAIEKRILKLVEQTNFDCRYILLVGVILINGDPQIGSFSNPQYAKLIDSHTKEEQTILSLF